MNLALIDAAVAAYQKKLDESDRARLAFFQKIWHEQAACEQEFAGSLPAYELPSREDLSRCYRATTPIFLEFPVVVNGEVLGITFERLLDVVCREGSYPDALVDELRSPDWRSIVAGSDVAFAGTDAPTWLVDFFELVRSQGLSKEAARQATLVASLALKIQLEKPSSEVMVALRHGEAGPHPLVCPVCGCLPTLSHVGGDTSSSGRGRLLVCPQCAASWEFERIRCARCGTHHQGRLHFYNIEGDPTHRLATCDECGGYIRAVFSDEPKSFKKRTTTPPLSYEVEDVVMIRLDALARSRFAH